MDRQLPKLQGLGAVRQRDENAPSHDLFPLKSLYHQRNKSMSALTAGMQAKTSITNQPIRRAAFADISNTRHDENKSNNAKGEKDGVIKAAVQQIENNLSKFKGLRPATRPISINKALPAEPVYSQVAAQSTEFVQPRKTLTKRHTTIFSDASYASFAPIAPIESKASLMAPITTSRVEPIAIVTAAPAPVEALPLPMLEALPEVSPEPTVLPPLSSIHLPIASQMEQKAAPPPSILPVPALLSMPSEMLSKTYEPVIQEYAEPELFLPALEMQPPLPVIEALPEPAVSQPTPSQDLEEYWDDDEEEFFDAEGYATARSIRSMGGENTTGGMSIVLVPRVTARVERELAAAKLWVEENLVTEEELDDECWDTTMVVEYSDEIFTYLRDLETRMMPNPYYMDNQTEIQWSMRSVLIDWVTQVHLRFQLLPETLFLAVNCIDRFLTVKVVSLAKLQLVGATALYIAAKYEEINCPSVQEIAYMVDGSYSIEEILKAERFMLTMLKFEMGWPGPMSFLRRISKADDYDVETRTLAKYFLEVCMMDERFVGCTPSFLAAGAHCLSRLLLKKGTWSHGHAHYSQFTYSQIRGLMVVMLECCQKQREHHNAVFDKYAQKQYKKASVFVETELLRGFELPAVVRRESSLGVTTTGSSSAASCGVLAMATAAMMPSVSMWRPQTSK